ncbi:hypothetical protein AP053_gp076 [Ostreococcus mediterraneus virus 1]|uniref:hypothetical protein n=1 Tax=Ostreococcus mediterraneus virus 1 TaxID=1663210 RepID=UPI0006D05CA7|nr:hypothetical protein AP053_gp076 [Ostreococcus mediterraneus virus 1]ALI95187.1 hypothetical protein OmV1_076 [Ostreococcus mediterraneus virus 1]
MALVTSPQTIPDLDYEYHTITIDTIGQDSANTFTCHLQQPLKNVVQARLLAAHIHSNVVTEHCYVSVEELDTIFNDRASNVLTGQGHLSMIRGSFASLITESATHAAGNSLITFKDNYPIVSQYIDPIRRIDRLSVTIRDQNGNTIKNSTDDGANFLVFRFVCRKPNL